MKSEENQSEESKAFGRRFKYALIGYAVIEFIVIAAVLYYKMSR